MAAVARKQIKLYVVLILSWIAISTTLEIQKVEVDVCSEPYPPMPNFYYSETQTNGNGLECYECEVANTSEISDKTCNIGNCTGTGPAGSLPTCYRWEFTYKGIDKNLIRTGCSVNCSSINYKQYMCSGVGEKVFEKCDFTMCSGNKCNSAFLSSYSSILLVPTLFLTYFQY